MNKFLSIFLLSLSFSAIFSNSDSESDSSGNSSPGLSDDDRFALAFSKNSKNGGAKKTKDKQPAKKSPRMSSNLPLDKRVLEWQQNKGKYHFDNDPKYAEFSEEKKEKARFLHNIPEAVDKYYDLAIPKNDDKQCAIPAFLWMDKDLDGREKMPCQVEYGQTSQDTVYHRFLKTTKLDQDVENKANRLFVNRTKDPKPLRDKKGLPLKFTDGSFVVDDNDKYVEICHPMQNGGYHLFLYK